jgi:hypothetical protein
MSSGFSLRAGRFWLGKLVYWCFMAAQAGLLLVYFCRVSGVGGHGPAKIERLLAGRADRPYAYRALLPAAANLLSPLLPPRLAAYIGMVSERALGEGVFLRRFAGAQYPAQAVLILAMMYLSLVGFSAVAFRLLAELGYLPWVGYLGAVALLLGTRLFMHFGYIYDFATLFMFSLGLLLMFRRQWGAYMLVFALGTLNKETTIFLSLIYVLYYWHRLSGRRLLGLLSVQLAIYGLVQGIMRFMYRQNPGNTALWHWPDQVAALKALALSDPFRLAVAGMILVIVAALIAYRWSHKPGILRKGLALLPLFLVLFMLWGYPNEIRVMLEVYPIVAILLLPPQLMLPAFQGGRDGHKKAASAISAA